MNKKHALDFKHFLVEQVRLDELPVKISVQITYDEKRATATYVLEEIKDLNVGWKKISGEGELKTPDSISREEIRYAIDMADFFKEIYPGAQVECSTDEVIDYDPT